MEVDTTPPPLPPTLTDLAQTHPDLLAESVGGALSVADLANLTQTSKLFLSIAVADLNWKPRVLGRSWLLAPIPLSGEAAVALWRAGDADAGAMSVGELKAVLTSRQPHQPLPLEKGELRAAAAAALVGDLPKLAHDGDGWWRRLYRALCVGVSVRRTRLLQGCTVGEFDRLFVARTRDWDHGWYQRTMRLEDGRLAFFDDSGRMLAQADLRRCMPTPASRPAPCLQQETYLQALRRRERVRTDLHGQDVTVPADAVALRYPEDVQPADNEYAEESDYGLVGCLHEELAEEGPPDHCFVILNLGVDVVLRAKSDEEREAWVERINAQACFATYGPSHSQADLELFRRLGLVRCERPLSLDLPTGLMARLKL